MYTVLEQKTIKDGAQMAKYVITSVKPLIDGLNAIYDPVGGLKDTITQDDLDSDASLSGLTKQQLDDGMYALTATLRADINAAYTQLAILAARAQS